jgi:hypothetical protein
MNMHRAAILIVSVALTALQSAAAQEIYRWVDEQGVVHFSDTAPVAEGDVSTVTLTTPARQ